MKISSNHRLTEALVGALFCALVFACASDKGDGNAASDGGSSLDGAADASRTDCRKARDANTARSLIVARPYGDQGVKADRWELLTLSAAGDISSTSTFFEMGRATSGVIAFTPDGEIGLVAQEGGSVGVFRIDESGAVEVLHASLEGDFYASEIVMSPEGDRAFIVDGNWRENGGGIYSLSIGCDDSIKVEGLLVSAKLPRHPLWKQNGDMVVVAHDYADSAEDQDLHLVSNTGWEAVKASTTVFPDRDAIVASAAITHDENFVLIGDGSGFSGVPNRVAVARVTEQGLEALQLLTPIEDPFAIATSPFDDAALVVSGFGDAIFALAYDPGNSTAPFVQKGELAYQGGRPQLPSSLAVIDRGDLIGLVLIAENGGIRRVAFEGEGAIDDMGLTAIGTSYGAIVGAIGVQP